MPRYFSVEISSFDTSLEIKNKSLFIGAAFDEGGVCQQSPQLSDSQQSEVKSALSSDSNYPDDSGRRQSVDGTPSNVVDETNPYVNQTKTCTRGMIGVAHHVIDGVNHNSIDDVTIEPNRTVNRMLCQTTTTPVSDLTGCCLQFVDIDGEETGSCIDAVKTVGENEEVSMSSDDVTVIVNCDVPMGDNWNCGLLEEKKGANYSNQCDSVGQAFDVWNDSGVDRTFNMRDDSDNCSSLVADSDRSSSQVSEC